MKVITIVLVLDQARGREVANEQNKNHFSLSLAT